MKKFFKFKKGKLSLIIIIATVFLFISAITVYALNTWATGYRVNTETKDVLVGASQACHKVTNTSSNSYFIPTKTTAEWDSFASHLPSGVSIGSCLPAPVLLLHTDGSDGSTSFPDSSLRNHNVNRAGNAQIDTSSKKFGTGSLLCDGSGDYLSVPDSNGWYMASGRFTIDMWVRLDRTNTIAEPLFMQSSGPTDHITMHVYPANNQIVLVMATGFTQHITMVGSYSFSAGTWYHIALIRGWGGNANTWAITVNGNPVATQTNSVAWKQYSGPFYIGYKYSTHPIGYYYLDGRIDEYRVTKGTTLWTSNFAPPTAPHPL